MTAPATFQPDPTIMEAHRILIGGEVINSAYTHRDWIQAAQCAMDGDTADMEYMLDRDDAFERFQAATPPYCERDDLGDFATWADRFAPYVPARRMGL